MTAQAWPEFVSDTPDSLPTSSQALKPAFLAIRFTSTGVSENCRYDTLRAAAEAARRWSEDVSGTVQVYALVEEIGPCVSVERRVVR